MKVLLFANTDWYLYNFRLPLARALCAQGHEVVLLSPPGRYGHRLEAEGMRWIVLPMIRRRLDPLAELITVLRLALVYRRERPDLVHHFTIKCVVYGTLAARLAGVASIVNALAGLGHIFIDDHLWVRWLRRAVKLILRLVLGSTQVIFQNPDDRQEFIDQRLVQSKKAHLIRGSGVDTGRFKPAAPCNSNGRRTILLASRLLWAKGLAEYVEAARLVRKSFPSTCFLIAGESDPGNPAAIPERTLDEWRRGGDVEILGHREDIESLIAQADIVVLPSYREGLPRCLLEAAASGKPVVATDVPGCREIVRAGDNGFLVPPKNSGKLAEAIEVLIADDRLRERMGRRSRQIACAEFSEQQVIARTLAVYAMCADLRLSREANEPVRAERQ